MTATDQHSEQPAASGTSLRRTLGLTGVLTLSIGAMIGSGIFVLPAVLAKAEMATAMPSAGGTYLYVDRAMGPLLGTIAGFGVWFSLTFKSAFALVGAPSRR